jgi:ATP-dependent RNA helicase MSS116
MDASALQNSRRRANPSKKPRGNPNKRPKTNEPREQTRGQGNAAAPAAAAAPLAPVAPLSIPVPEDSMRFTDLKNLLDPLLLKTITDDLKFDRMMPVQEATLSELLEKRIDCLAQAKTGTGKTVAFLLPAIQTLINKNKPRGSGISLLVISPTRELAMQIAQEASNLLQRLPQFKVCVAIGGTNKDKEERDILRGDGCDILIATPGRLYDHLGNQQITQSFRNLDTLVLDEADRLLDMGFMEDLKKIIRCLPDKEQSKRQGMLRYYRASRPTIRSSRPGIWLQVHFYHPCRRSSDSSARAAVACHGRVVGPSCSRYGGIHPVRVQAHWPC